MLTGFWKLMWVEIKIFVREPLGVLGTVIIPVVMFLVLGRALRDVPGSGPSSRLLGEDIPIFAAIFIAISAVLSLVAIMSIYRESGILRRLRATPLQPLTILGAHVFVKLVFTGITLGFLVLAGRRFYPVTLDLHPVRFGIALLVSMMTIFSIGFVIAGVIPTARFAQPIGSIILYPMLAVSGIFVPIDAFPRGWRLLSEFLPLTHAVSLLRGAWIGAGWADQLGHLGVLVLYTVLGVVVASRVFRWE